MKTVKGKYVEGSVDEINKLFAGNTIPVPHTPTPWKVDNYGNIKAGGMKGLDNVTVEGFSLSRSGRKNSAFIVRAVNRDQSNMDALYEISSILQAARSQSDAVLICDRIEGIVCEAIAKAEGL